MKNMKFWNCLAITAAALLAQSAVAQEMSTPPATPAELEVIYTRAINERTENIVAALNLTDAAKSNQVQKILIRQYRLLRARDMVIDATLTAEGKDASYANRASFVTTETKPLHDYFLAELGRLLTPSQVDTIKDRMTYNKLEVTYNAYCEIIPGLDDAAKAKIKELLTAAREEAMDAGSAGEKSAMFQKYKDQINAYLNGHGYDVKQAYKDWEAKHPSPPKAGGTKAE